MNLIIHLITRFTKDIDIKFGLEKCSYIYTEWSKRKSLVMELSINNIQIQEFDPGETYTFLWQDEDISFKEELKKQQATKKYLRRVKQIQNFELYSRNNALHTTQLQFMYQRQLSVYYNELEEPDPKTRKLLTASGSFYIDSDIERLYCYRKHNGRGLNSITDTYILRIVTLSLHLKNTLCENQFL